MRHLPSLVLSAVTVSLWVDVASTYFVCPKDCSLLPCLKLKTLRKQCKGGTVYDVCGCCQRCAKVEGEECGGFHDIRGICDAGLYCSRRKRVKDIGRCKRKGSEGDLLIPTSSTTQELPRKPKKKNLLELRFGNQITVCQPRCSADFCSKWPDAVCSAVANAVIERPCQIPCQHTICHACYFETKEEPPCRRCKRDDFDCMRKFAKCVKKDHCTRAKYPCQPHAKRKSDGNFVCKVPACE